MNFKILIAAAAVILLAADAWQRKSLQSAGLACLALAILFL